jgi:NitT/TauT family transport system substrate-binding protein
MQIVQSRRDFLAAFSAAGALSPLCGRCVLADEAPLEVTTVRLRREPGLVKLLDQGVVENPICIAPQYMAEELLSAEGFTEVRYVSVQGGPAYSQAFERRELDFGLMFAPGIIRRLDAGVPITVLAGIHPGCFELFAHEHIRGVADLKGKQVGIHEGPGSPPQLYVSIMAAHVGIDPEKEIKWITTDDVASPMELFVQGKIDAFLTFVPQPQQLRARKIGRAIVNMALDRPWSHYYCCMLVGEKEFVRNYPVATKRAVRAILKAADLCATEPARVTRRLVDDGFAQNYEYGLQILKRAALRRLARARPRGLAAVLRPVAA